MSTVYVDATTFVSYAQERGVTITEDVARIELRKAQDYIDDAYYFVGNPVFSGSSFPRNGLLEYDNKIVPYSVKLATMRIALMSINGVSIYDGVSTQLVKKEVVASGRLETEYETENATSTQNAIKFPSVTKLLYEDGLLDDASSGFRLYGLRG